MKINATPSDLREQGREAFRLFLYYAHNPYVRSEDTCAFENWFEGWAQAEWAATFKEPA